MSKLTLTTEGETHLVVTRRFAAPPEAVYRAHTEAELLRKWLLGPDGWTMPVCISDVRPGGAIRYEWTDGKGGGFHLTGEYVELEPFNRIVHVERMHLPDPTPDNHVETRFVADGSGTLMTMRMTLPDAGTRAAMLATGMEQGMEASYVRLDGMLQSAPPRPVASPMGGAAIRRFPSLPDAAAGPKLKRTAPVAKERPCICAHLERAASRSPPSASAAWE